MLNGLKYFCTIITATALLAVSSTAGASVPKGWSSSKYAALVVDANSGEILHSRNGGAIRHPASLTKMMTLYVAFSQLSQRKLRFKQYTRISAHAAAQPAMRIGLKKGSTVPIQTLVQAVIVKSGNGAAVALAEAISGSESRFAGAMNRTARKLGMKDTHFRNASGLPDRRQVTTARDMVKLAMALKRDFPQYYHLFKKEQFSYRGQVFTSHNRVTRNYRGADGLKTGYIRASGFNLVTSAERHGKRIVGVVLGGSSGRSRDRHMTRLLDMAFANKFKNTSGGRVYAGNRTIPTVVRKPGAATYAEPVRAVFSTAATQQATSDAAGTAKAAHIEVAFNPTRDYGFLPQKTASAPVEKDTAQTAAYSGKRIPMAMRKPQIAANIAFARSAKKNYTSPFIERMSPDIKPVRKP